MMYDACVCSGPGKVDWGSVFEGLKPGSFLAVVASARTHHRVTDSIEKAGFDIRDTILFVFQNGGGIPENLLISLARKPFNGTLKANVVQWGTGGLNIDAARIDVDPNIDDPRLGGCGTWRTQGMAKNCYGSFKGVENRSSPLGRWPTNVVHDNSPMVVSNFPVSNGARTGNLDDFNPVSVGRYFYSVDSNDRMEGLIKYLEKLITSPCGEILRITNDDLEIL